MIFSLKSLRPIRLIFLVLAAALFFPLFSVAQNDEPFALRAEPLNENKTIELNKLPWKYRSGDDQAWASADLDDSDWKRVTNEQINRNPSEALENWNGKGWFRLRVEVDPALANKPLAFRTWHWGASEIYLDGELIQAYGEIKPNDDVEYNPRGAFLPVVFENGGAHTIAVRYSFQATKDLNGGYAAWLRRAGHFPGFLLHVESAGAAVRKIEERFYGDWLDYAFIGLLTALAFVHLLLFAFYPAAGGNLYYSIFVAGIAATMFLSQTMNGGNLSAVAAAVLEIVRLTTQAVAMMSLLAFLYFEFNNRQFSLFYRIMIGVWLAAIALTAAQADVPFPYFLILLIITLADAVRIIIRSLVKKMPGSWNIAAGVVVLVVGVLNNIAFERDFFSVPDWVHEINLYAAIIAVPVAVSFYLARNFAGTNKNLELQLVKEIEYEKERARLEIVEAENERRAKELEEARRLQLSLLPKKLPVLANVEIAAYMKPATEVGGDYYDFHLASDGVLTVAIGDATGHGLKAGSIVTATKSLFNAFAETETVCEILNRKNAALKQMNLRGLFMAMTILKIRNNRLTIGAAGMPAALIYRSATERVEEISLKALPLGSVAKISYRQIETSVAPGDCVLLMSDGFPEMFNAENEMLGFDCAPAVLPEIAHKSAQEIVDHLVETGERWANGRPPDDDVTFVVLKVKTDSHL